ncbi:uncharacterized protein CG3556-like isoform X2 [Stegodyphus dumicola]|uniref:uncharacterized protein CG3556-like isoform X2 n=1 Tax=Stegodyphus dumicola TaxID=202533 RepID=UPI0015ABC944|nr:uncharacterized protein CG3556-like isoform X2 [Stegodyphus dumicola]
MQLLGTFMTRVRLSNGFAKGSNELNGVFAAKNPCITVPLGGVEWILAQRRPDYGWKQDTHRAIIALSVNGWKNVPKSEILQSELQLCVEITDALMRDTLYPMNANDLALYVQSLIAINKNPRNFHGFDLVGKLLKLVKEKKDNHPFLVLALCDANAATLDHFSSIREYSKNEKASQSRLKYDYEALALKAFACGRLSEHLKKYGNEIDRSVRNLISRQNDDGSFGNIYTTALIVQALIASGTNHRWKKDEALRYLKKASTAYTNMVFAYYIELALNADSVPFIKSLHPDLNTVPQAPPANIPSKFLHYSLRSSDYPDVYYTIGLKVPRSATFFDVMKDSTVWNPLFRFNATIDRYGIPHVYSISGKPNDAEANLYWRLCKQRNNDAALRSVKEAPIHVQVEEADYFIYWYTDKSCEQL